MSLAGIVRLIEKNTFLIYRFLSVSMQSTTTTLTSRPRDDPHIGSVQFVCLIAVSRCLFSKDHHVKSVKIHFGNELPGTPPLAGLGTTVDILKADIVTETAYDIEP